MIHGYGQSIILYVFFGILTEDILTSMNKMMLTSLAEYFQQLFWMTESCMKVRFTQLRVIAIFDYKHSQGSIATRLWCGGIFSYCSPCRNLLLVSRWKNFENWSAIGKVIETKIEWNLFQDTVYNAMIRCHPPDTQSPAKVIHSVSACCIMTSGFYYQWV